MDQEIDIYKQLAYMGIEARFFCLEGFKNIETKQPTLHLAKETGKKESPMPGVEQIQQIQEMSNKMNLLLERTEEIFQRINTHLSSLGQETRKPSEQDLLETKPILLNITVFKIDENLFGVESEKVCRLFKVPSSFHDKVRGQEKIRLKDFEVRMINLKKLFSIQGGDRKGEVRILTVKDNGEYKGLMVDEVLKRLSTHSEMEREQGEYFVGRVRWTYQQHPVEIPILDLKKL
jgi:chemotaxis signal transduction protein